LPERAHWSKVTAPKVSESTKETFSNVVKRFREVFMATNLKPSTRGSYASILERTLIPRFGERAIRELTGNNLASLDAELVAEGYLPSSRRNYHVVFRSVLRWAAQTGSLTEMPRMPRLPQSRTQSTATDAPRAA
jgi:hypothetical protein